MSRDDPYPINFRTTCRHEGCDRSASLSSMQCTVHTVLMLATHVPSEEFVLIQQGIAEIIPPTTEELAEQRVQRHLRSVMWHSDQLVRSQRRAAEAGATDTQIQQASTEGASA